MISVEIVRRSLRDDVDQIENEKDISHWAPDTTIWTLIWIGVLLLILICPFLSNKRRRALCYKRLIERDWNFSYEEGDEGNTTFIPHERILR